MELELPANARRVHQLMQEKITVFTVPRPEKKVHFIQFNLNQYPFTEREVREAIRGAIDQDQIRKDVIDPKGHTAHSVIDITNPYSFKELYHNNYQPEKSLTQLQQNGWTMNQSSGSLMKNGQDLTFELIFEEHSQMEETVARLVKIQLAELGINVQPRPVNFMEKERRIRQSRFSATIRTFSYFENDIYNVTKIFYYSVLKNNDFAPNYVNETLERAMNEADRDREYRKLFIQRYQTFLYRDAPAVFLFFDDKIIYAVKNRFKNFRVNFNNNNVYYFRLAPFEDWFVPKSLQKY
jgi:ABC-type transport system substrate-binding protein